LLETVNQFWNKISDFEGNERENESQNFLLAEARAGARMEAYVNLFYALLWE